MVNFNNKYTILIIVLVALALLFAVWGIYKKYFSSKVDRSQPQYDRHNDNDVYVGGRKRRRTKKVNKK
jgi:hypothetical protein